MNSAKPTIGPGLAERWARDIYGIEATASLLPGYIDCNFLLSGFGGMRRVFKVATYDRDRNGMDCQLEVLRHLEVSDLSALVPRVIHNLDGRGLSEGQDSDGRSYLLRMVSYLEGRPLAMWGAATPELRREIGRTMGRLDSVLESFEHSGAHRELVWDLARLMDLCPFLEMVGSDVRSFVEAGLGRFKQKVQPRLGELRSSIIHNDANDYNILVRKDDHGRLRLSGLIDFGDIVHTVTVAEIAIACAYAMLAADDPSAAEADVVAGYEEVLPLEPLERQLLPDLIVGRLCASLLMSAKAKVERPDDEYLKISEQPVVALLKRLS